MITSWLEYGRSRYIQVSTGQKLSLEKERGYLKREIRKRLELQKELQKQANVDDLTQLYNHRHFWFTANGEIDRIRSFNSTATMAILDIDRFKSINDTYGHPSGDEVLKYFGQYFKQHLRKSDTVGRIGGEEFAILLPYTSIEEAKSIMEKLRQQISDHRFTFQEDSVQVTVSVGICEFGQETNNIECLYALADKALFDAKENGRNQVQCR
ncbi:GGDEF domain-containing protein [Vibrio sp. JC009]|uniref:GGDEF domain-containing protein n=1 Tax=Vibrio sp. JC009 TaxID=2912314 RepID=UPI0023B143A2|nr:GGDEF domain-containing protein [Vibrio sp. JC009]WED20535.1 GGDEF domain-containing protein [Vibrio sp. JC009]